MLAWTRYFAEVQALFVGTGMAVALTSRRRVAHRAICIAAMVLAAEVSVLSAQSTADSAEAEQVTVVGQGIDTNGAAFD